MFCEGEEQGINSYYTEKCVDEKPGCVKIEDKVQYHLD